MKTYNFPLNRSSESLHAEESIENVFAVQNIDPALRTILNSRMPVWLTLSQTGASNGNCYMSCMAKGLKWAQTLGDASRSGFKMVYTPIDQNEWFKPSLTYYTTLLHKRLMGETVLDTKILNGNRFDAHVYSHCTRNVSGAFTIYGVNTVAEKASVLAKMPPMRAGTEYMEYVLTVNSDNGKVQLNGNDIVEDMPLNPVIKSKRFNKPALLSMPAHSVGFWVFSKATLPECERAHDVDQTRYTRLGKTSSEQLLQDLIQEEIQREDEMEKNSIDKTTSTRRERRAIHNDIEKGYKLNAIKKNINGDENDIQKRNRRSINDQIAAARLRRAGNLMLFVYNEMDLNKGRYIHLPFLAKLDSDTEPQTPRRAKRHINGLSRLLEKFEFKKPAFNFKPAPFKLGAAAIPPITAVHDIYAVNPAEHKVFNSVENPELPAGDVHFEFEELANGAQNAVTPGYNGAANVGYNIAEVPAQSAPIQEIPIVNEPIPEVVPETLNAQNPSEPYYESLFGDAPLPQTPSPPQALQPPAPALVTPQRQPSFDELWEMDAAQFPSMPSLAPKQPNLDQNPAINTNIEFVVKELQPTWQMNQENMEKARKNLEKYYQPPLGNSKISSLLPNVARFQSAPSPFFDSAEKRFFETRRRRRSIDAGMNEEIEERVQEMAAKRPHSEESGEYNDLDDAIDKLSILDRALKIVADIDPTRHPDQTTDLAKITADLKKLGEIVAKNMGKVPSSTPSTARTTDDENLQKRCKILSKSLEQRCLREPVNPLVTFFKRDNEDKAKKPTGPIKKLLAKVKEIQRPKRSIGYSNEEILVNDIRLNEIQTELFGEPKPKGIEFVKTPYVRRGDILVAEKTKKSDLPQEPVPKILRAVKTTVNRLLDSVARHVASLWHALS